MAGKEETKLCEILKTVLKDYNVDMTHLKVCRKQRDLKYGDFVVPKGVLGVDITDLNLENICKQETAQSSLPVARISYDKFSSVIFHVDRQKAFRNIVRQVLTEGNIYGCQPIYNQIQKIIVNPIDLITHTPNNMKGSNSIVQLRAVILLKHILNLLKVCGYQAEVAKFSASEDVEDLFKVLKVERMETICRDIEKTSQEFLERAKTSHWREEFLDDHADTHESEESRKSEKVVVLNAKKIIKDKELLTGKNGFENHIHLIHVVREDGTLSETLLDAAYLDTLFSSFIYSDRMSSPYRSLESDVVCIHLVSQSLEFRQQQVQLLWQVCSTIPHCSQKHLVFGSVKRRKPSAGPMFDAKEYYSLRYAQMTQAAMMKYGDHDPGVEWEDLIGGLTVASITFELLGTTCRSSVHLDLAGEDGEESADKRGGLFVMYNFARLAALLNSFQEKVKEGLYPELPDSDHIDYSLLREEEEWSIAMLYLETFPQLVLDTVEDLKSSKGIAVKIHTHKVVHFLLNFAKTLSSYYSRYHILGGPEEHLLPLMFARLTLMKAAQQVLFNALTLLGLEPISQL